MSSSIYLKQSAGERRAASLHVTNWLKLLSVVTLIVIALLAFCCYCSQWRMYGGVATSAETLVDTLAASTKLPSWLVWAANIGDQVLAIWHSIV